ncbi:MAG: hypothetical protein Q7U04_11265 [Bacteriovorax sp.]|nr:hypothetical protein [Bacteriovorax sp.]
MKKSSLIIGLLMNLMPASNAFAARGDVTPDLNQCAAVMDSKVYSTSDFSAYPRDVAFECLYSCNSNGNLETVKGSTKIRINNIEEDIAGTTCQGVVMKKVPWGYDFDKIRPFYAPDTNIVELKRWAFQNIKFNPEINDLEKERLMTLKKDLNTISSSFIVAGMNGGVSTIYFKEAGYKISKIAEGLPMNTKLLDEVIEQLMVNKGTKAAAATPEFLIYPMISNAASWRIQSYLYK